MRRSTRGKRLQASTEDVDGSPPSKKPYVSTSRDHVTSLPHRWEWEGDGGQWTQFPHKWKLAITKAYNEDKNDFEFSVGRGVRLAVVFSKMLQKNKKTGFSRRVRFCVQSNKATDFYAWQWKDESGKWSPYSPKITEDLELAHSKDPSTDLEFDVGGTTYRIDFSAMTQVNTKTDFSRAISREKSDAVLTDVKDEEDDDMDISTASKAAGDASSKSKKSSAKSSTAAAKSKGKTSAQSGRSKSTKVKKEEGEEEEEVKVRTVIVKGRAPVDPECVTMAGKAHVFFEGNDVWDCMLNQTDVGNNNNKFYLIQLLKDDSKTSYYIWQRWGRVGYSGQNNLIPCSTDLDKAKKMFCKKFSDKTKNDWADRKGFAKVPGKYDLLAMDYSSGNQEEDEVDASLKKESSINGSLPDSKLDKRLQDLINLICDVKSMEEAVTEMKYDAKKAPLGKLTTNQIKAGYSALKKIEQCVNNKDFGQHLTQACNEFYTRIPHEFGMKTPPLIRDKVTVKAKLQLLEALGDIEIAIKILKKGDMSENPVDRHYHSLECKLEPLDHTDSEFKLMNDFLQTTHASTHNMYKMELQDVFNCQKDPPKFKDYGNKMLLWHGSRLTNWVGILSQGLRIAPPEAPVTGYMFGKGIYFADISSKSANYCFTSRAKNIGLLLVCEVSLGNVNELLAADYNAAAMPAGKHSVKGVGRIAPDPKSHKTLDDGTTVPIGKGIDMKIKNPTGYTLNYNEFIVYDVAQIKPRYLLKVKFHYS
ncbi:poly [ADP-ribose] polymerase 2-like [Gigantopelta aegis]|uniref:poly [ADP-ribose] polymerase 2-like n=1 Tax=Gigantopelta aegis TaxID=1735272 RepID=UPI001B88D9BC|nr:poly [ADP-ribose] polymerase 2-like [Gigantopelta aegis]